MLFVAYYAKILVSEGYFMKKNTGKLLYCQMCALMLANRNVLDVSLLIRFQQPKCKGDFNVKTSYKYS